MANNDTMTQSQPTQLTDKELNFRKQEEMFNRKLEQERQARLAMEKELQELKKPRQQVDDDEDDDEPYVDKRKLTKTLSQFGQQTKQETANIVQQEVSKALAEERKNMWVKQHNDFNQVMTPENIQKFADKHPDLAEDILAMPEGFERQKLVYRNIKALGIDKPEVKPSSIQEKIDANRKSPYYQPSGVGSAPYAAVGDFSPSGQKNSYYKMKELQNRLRLN